jgi:sigma-B regulation protein RsbU (phosphoserine phosphatase)
VTFFFGRLDLKSGLFRYSNAGHNPPVWISAQGEMRFLRDSDLILGVQEDVVYHEFAIELGKGDLVLLYTDGLTDELNPENESFGEERLQALAQQNRDLPPAELCDRILAEVTAFMGGEVRDDVTLLAFRYL